MELLIMLIIAVVVLVYRMQSETDESIFKTISNNIKDLYNKYAPYSYQDVKEKSKALGQDYSVKEYMTQIVLIGGLGAAIGFFYFWSIIYAIIYGVAFVMFIPYLTYLKNNKTYSEFIFEEVQVYCSNVINEFNATQSFVKSLEGVRDSGILEDPILTDVKILIDQSYKNGTIDEAVEEFNRKYPYYMVKNMHQLFLQITKEGAQDSGESLENMMLDIDTLVEGVYRDKMDRDVSHKKFVTFGVILYFLAILTQFLMGDSYKKMISMTYVKLILHGIVIINSYFIISGEKFYNEDTGVE